MHHQAIAKENSKQTKKQKAKKKKEKRRDLIFLSPNHPSNIVDNLKLS